MDLKVKITNKNGKIRLTKVDSNLNPYESYSRGDKIPNTVYAFVTHTPKTDTITILLYDMNSPANMRGIYPRIVFVIDDINPAIKITSNFGYLSSHDAGICIMKKTWTKGIAPLHNMILELYSFYAKCDKGFSAQARNEVFEKYRKTKKIQHRIKYMLAVDLGYDVHPAWEQK